MLYENLFLEAFKTCKLEIAFTKRIACWNCCDRDAVYVAMTLGKTDQDLPTTSP